MTLHCLTVPGVLAAQWATVAGSDRQFMSEVGEVCEVNLYGAEEFADRIMGGWRA